MIAVREYTDAASLLADIKALRARFAALKSPPPVVEVEQPPVRPKILVFPINRTVSMAEVVDRYRYSHPRCRLFARDRVNERSEAELLTDEITRECAGRHGLRVTDILSECRVDPVVRARQEAIWLCARDTPLSYPKLGRIFKRDHTTILHAIRMENDRRGENLRGCGGVPFRRVEAKRATALKSKGLSP